MTTSSINGVQFPHSNLHFLVQQVRVSWFPRLSNGHKKVQGSNFDHRGTERADEVIILLFQIKNV